jgi:Zn-dependent M28 family amino/carboxypeptidase
MLGASGSESCLNEAWDSLDVEGKIVLIEEGSCPNETVLIGSLRYAAAAGALSVVIYQDGALERVPGLLAPNHGQYVPGATTETSDVVPLLTRLQSGEKIEAYLQLTQTFENRTTQNVITETEDGDPTNVIMVGAHLDSVQKGPGINDNGSGTSLILALKIALEKFNVRNKVRFAWWGAEENGGIGSQFYIKHLDALSADNILAYLNFDMVSHGPFQIMDGDGSSYHESLPPGSDVVERVFFDDMTRKDINVSAGEFTNRSDHASFWGLGKPIGGLTTGWAEDPCYHRACDNYDNANPTTLTVNAKASISDRCMP